MSHLSLRAVLGVDLHLHLGLPQQRPGGRPATRRRVPMLLSRAAARCWTIGSCRSSVASNRTSAPPAADRLSVSGLVELGVGAVEELPRCPTLASPPNVPLERRAR